MGNSQFVGTDLTNLLDGLQAPYYFNGRLLTAEDLKQDQQATLTRQRWLGQAVGFGVITGLLVTKNQSTSITVTAGVGLNLQGDLITLPNDLTLPLIPQTSDNQPIPDTGRFSTCDFQSVGSSGSVSAGAYLLTILPASHFKDLAPMKAAAGSTNNASSTPGCGSKWEVEGVRFKIIPLPIDVTSTNSGVTDNNRRNLIAHWCFGTGALADLGRDPFIFSTAYSGLDQIASSDLTQCDLPLAVFYWTGTALSFVDDWSVRRRITHPMAFVGSWLPLMSDKRVAENQARFLQFQDQLEDLMFPDKTAGPADLSQVRAIDYFRFLPPLGFLPITPASLLAKLSDQINYEVALAAEALTPGPPVSEPAAQARMLNLEMMASPDLLAVNTSMQRMNSQLEALRQQVDVLRKQAAGSTTPAASETAAPLSGGGSGGGNSGGGGPPPDELLREAIRPYLLYRFGSATGGFDLNQFFGDLSLHIRINLIGSDTVGLMLHSSWYEESINLGQFVVEAQVGVIDLARGTAGVRRTVSPANEALRRNLSAFARTFIPFSGGGGGSFPPLPTPPAIIDIYLVEENLRDTSAQLFVLFHKAPHPTELVDARAVPQG